MSLPEPPFTVEEIQALPPDTQRLVKKIIDYYEQVVADLKAKLDGGKKTPRNSSLPPSSEHPHAKPKRDKKKSKKKRGGQPGHPKHERPLIPAEQCKEVILLKPTECRRCGAELNGSDPEPIRHQVWELPVIKPDVTEFLRHRLDCPCCGETTCADLPAGVPIGQSGPRLVAFVGLLMGHFRQSKRRAAFFLVHGKSAYQGLENYHAFGVRGYQYVRQSFGKSGIEFTIKQERCEWRCSACDSWEVKPKGRIPREFKTLPIGGKPVTLLFEVPRVECCECRCRRQVKLGFADPHVSYTRAFARYALDLSRHMTIQDVADHLQVSWHVIKEIQRADLQRRFARPKLKKVRQIAIDEISIAKGHRYVTVVLDLESGVVLFVGDGKGADALLPFWRRLRASGARIRAVATDMSVAYIQAVSDNLKGAVHVFDHFHIIKLYNEKLTDLRRDVYRELTDVMHKDVLKGSRSIKAC